VVERQQYPPEAHVPDSHSLSKVHEFDEAELLVELALDEVELAFEEDEEVELAACADTRHPAITRAVMDFICSSTSKSVFLVYYYNLFYSIPFYFLPSTSYF
jgi:hypothetical protein